MIKKDRSIIQGKAEEIITSENMKKGYGVDVKIICDVDSCGNAIRACRLL